MIRLTPDEFQQIFRIFISLILLFMGFVGVMILRFEYRWRHPEPPPRRPPPPQPPPGAGRSDDDESGTFGISGMSASDMSTMDFGSSNDAGGFSHDSGGGSDSGGSGDFSGGGGDFGGGGASGGWD